MPQSATDQKPSGPLAWLIYPGSRVVLQVASDDGSRLLQLICFDPIDDVIAWYVEKFRPSTRIALPDGGAILKGSVTTVLILPADRHLAVTVRRTGPRFGPRIREPWS